MVTGALMAGMTQLAAAERLVVIGMTGLYAVGAAAVLGIGVLRHGWSLQLTRPDVWSGAAAVGAVCVWQLVDSPTAAVLFACLTIVVALPPALAEPRAGAAELRLTSVALSCLAGVAGLLAIGSRAIADVAVVVTVLGVDLMVLACAARRSRCAVRMVGRPGVADAAEAC